MQSTDMRDEDPDQILACSPVLQMLALTLSKWPQQISLCSKSAPLDMLGYLDPTVYQRQIGNIVINVLVTFSSKFH
jgi:hypothetical protein